MALKVDEFKQKYSEEIQELQRQLTEKDQILENYRREHGKLEIFFNKISDAIRPLSPLKKIYQPKKKSGSFVTAVMQIADGHCGAVQPADEIEGFNEFNPQICHDRQLNYATKFLDWVEMHRNIYRIDECAVIDTGDNISGDIHEELRVTNAFPSPVQCVKAGEILTEQLALLAPHFEKITVHFLVEDNHARLTKKPQAKEAGYNSLNYVVGKIAEIYLQRHDNIEFNIYPMFEKVISVSNLRYLISHGHGITGWMGIPWYSIERKVSRESMARLQIIMDDISRAKQIGFNKYIFSHWHVHFDHPLYSCCGSVSGTDAYDHKYGRHAGPSQSSWMVSAKHGEFNRINFNLNA
jgi:hypothetical protein